MELWKYIIKVIWKLSADKLGLEFSLRFTEPCLNTSFTLANLEGAGNFDEPIHCMKSIRTQTFIGQNFPVFSPTTGTLRPEKVRIWTLLKGIALLIWRHVYSAKWSAFSFNILVVGLFRGLLHKIWCLQESYFFSTYEK